MTKFDTTYWGPILVEKYGFTKADLTRIRKELDSLTLDREITGTDILQVAAGMGSKQAEEALRNSMLRKANDYLGSPNELDQRVGEGMRRIAILGPRREKDGD
jgi:hypothetical protein